MHAGGAQSVPRRPHCHAHRHHAEVRPQHRKGRPRQACVDGHAVCVAGEARVRVCECVWGGSFIANDCSRTREMLQNVGRYSGSDGQAKDRAFGLSTPHCRLKADRSPQDVLTRADRP
eukprot:366326-Chlamydomonas_euryale.AAC.9